MRCCARRAGGLGAGVEPAADLPAISLAALQVWPGGGIDGDAARDLQVAYRLATGRRCSRWTPSSWPGCDAVTSPERGFYHANSPRTLTSHGHFVSKDDLHARLGHRCSNRDPR
jgi:hypothetical protein